MANALVDMKLDSEIKISWRGIHGTLYYTSGRDSYEIPIVESGDHLRGILIFADALDPQIKDGESEVKKMRILRDIQKWAKLSSKNVSW